MAQVTRFGTLSTSSGTGADRTITSYSAGAGTDVVLVAIFIVSGTGAATNSVTFDGVAMTEVTASPQEPVTGLVEASMWYCPLGSAGVSGDVVADGSASFGSSKLIVFTLDNVDQTTPVEDSDGSVGFGVTSISDTSTHQADSLGIDCYAIDDDGIGTWSDGGAEQTTIQNSVVSATLGHASGASEEDDPDTSITMSWSGTSGNPAHILASFQPLTGAPIPSITSVDVDDITVPHQEDVDIAGTDFGVSTGKVYLADGAVFATATKIEQPVDTWADTAITLTQIDQGALLGTAATGTLWAFVEDAALAVSVAHPIFVGVRDVRMRTGTFVTPGATGNFDVDVLGFPDDNVKGVMLWWQPVTADDTDTADAVAGMGLGDGTSQASVYSYSEDAVTPAGNTRRERDAANILRMVAGGGEGSPLNVATLTGSIAGGFRLNFTTATAGYIVHYVAFGGSSVQATKGSAAVNSSPETGLAFRPELVCTMSFCDQLADPPADFGTVTWGFFNDQLEECLWSAYFGDDTADQAAKRRIANNDGYAAQTFNSGVTWTMSVTAINADGWSWSGSNSDGFDYLALHLAGVRTSIQQFTKSVAAAPATQALPSFGFIPQGYLMLTGARTNEATGASDVNMGLGAFDGAVQHCSALGDELNVDPSNARQRSFDGFVIGMMADADPGAVEYKAKAQAIGTDQSPDLVWDPNDAAADLMHVIAIEVPDEQSTALRRAGGVNA